MKKTIKILLASVGSIILLLAIAVSVVIWIAFTPAKITPIIQKEVSKIISCQSSIGEVELTFFSTFPNFGLKIKDFALYHQNKFAEADTIVNAQELTGILNLVAFVKEKKLIINELRLTNGDVRLLTDSLGHTNYNIAVSDTTSQQTEESNLTLNVIDIKGVRFANINLGYQDRKEKIDANVEGFSGKFNGSLSGDILKSEVTVSQSLLSFGMNDTILVNQAQLELALNSEANLGTLGILVKKGMMKVNNLTLELSGRVNVDTAQSIVETDISYSLKSWQIKEILALIPEAYSSAIKGTEADGLLSSTGTIKGTYSKTSMPIVDMSINLDGTSLKHPMLPFPLSNVETQMSVYADYPNDTTSFVTIHHFEANTPKSAIETKGSIKHLFSDIHCNLQSKANLTLEEFNSMIPADMKAHAKGRIAGSINTDFALSQMEKMDLDKMKIEGSLVLTNARIRYDSLTLETDRSAVDFQLPNNQPTRKIRPFAHIQIDATNLTYNHLSGQRAYLEEPFFIVETSDVRDTTKIPSVHCSFNITSLEAQIDTTSAVIVRPKGEVTLAAAEKSATMPDISLTFQSGSLKANSGNNSVTMNSIDINTALVNISKDKEFFKQWKARGMLYLEQGTIKLAELKYPLDIPAISINYSPEEININRSQVKIDKSDFRLSGKLTNLFSYMRGDSLLRGNFKFESALTDLNALMALTSGIGTEDGEADNKDADTQNSPFIVPMGMDITLNTHVDKAMLNSDSASDITGTLRLHDGILVLEGMKFNTPAANMQLTAMYRTPRKNHLFASFDYHMMDIEIAELLRMIPDIDSIMPMLRSFGGRGEFHMAAETYLDSMYNIKKSTLRGVSSIKGEDLVLMDGETFSEIAKTLKFNKKTENRVDTLSAEFTIFKQEVDIYPFLIVMDKYKAVVAGRHNLDLSFNYHISVVDSPLPIKLGVDVSGTMEDMKYKLAKCRYKEFYRPSSRKVVENKQLEIRKMIRDALQKRVQTE